MDMARKLSHACTAGWHMHMTNKLDHAASVGDRSCGDFCCENGIAIEDLQVELKGLAICLRPPTVHFICFGNREQNRDQGEVSSTEGTLKIWPVKFSVLSQLFADSSRTITCLSAHFTCKCALYLLEKVCDLRAKISCLETAAWLLNSSEIFPNFRDFVFSSLPNLRKTFGESFLPGNNFGHGRNRREAAVEALVCHKFEAILMQKLHIVNPLLLNAYDVIDSRAVLPLVKMEFVGFGFDRSRCLALKGEMQRILDGLEQKAKRLAGREFSISSPADVAKVLFTQLRLVHPEQAPLTKSSISRPKPLNRHYSTSKDVLEKLKSQHPLPAVILLWRKVHAILTKYLTPYLRRCKFDPTSGVYRLKGEFDFWTATGRVCMKEPNLQAVPKEMELDDCGMTDQRVVGGSGRMLNLRNLFLAGNGRLLVSADFSQLELRVLAHFSEDPRLLDILNSATGDVFRQIAASLNGVAEADVDEKQRQQAKQICYGIIYGMGPKALGEQLNLSEDSAQEFMDSFKRHFCEVQQWILEVVDDCRRWKFVETLSGRRRYLPHIDSKTCTADRAQAERQAVNTKVQGSAADLFKRALTNVDEAFFSRGLVGNISQEVFKNGISCVEGSGSLKSFKCGMDNGVQELSRSGSGLLKQGLNSGACGGQKLVNGDAALNLNGAQLVMQLHDELIVETDESRLNEVAVIMKDEMENCWSDMGDLKVKLRVRLKAGPTWGDMSSISGL